MMFILLYMMLGSGNMAMVPDVPMFNRPGKDQELQQLLQQVNNLLYQGSNLQKHIR
jgi:hypothetical protein